ncbi:MAG: tetratricopeptide repeat protein [Gemmatimonadota bacterium]|nr:MAG: tetratricopeptide repeat protein [Gemmatimonadota bacterium]
MKKTAGIVIALALDLGCGVALAQDSHIEVSQLADRLYLLSTDQGSYTTNTIAFVGEDGILLVDTQSEDDAEELKRAVDAFGRGTPKYIVNTHRHVEHVGGNAAFGDAPIVIAHALVPAKLRSGSYLFDEFPDETFPDITLADSLTLYFNGERIRILALPGSHDDNEIIVHFTESKVVHLSSLVNGFNFPSVDADGDVLRFAELVAKAIELLPEDVVIVSGHNDTGTWHDLQSYHDMLVQTTEIVASGLAEGKELAALQAENVLGEWESYAGSYVSVDEWIEYLVDALQAAEEPKRTVYEPLYYVWNDRGADAALAHYFELQREHPEEYQWDDFTLLVIGNKLLANDHIQDAVKFLDASLEEYPESPYNYYANYKLAEAYYRLNDRERAARYCEKSLELNPEFAAAIALLEELGKM